MSADSKPNSRQTFSYICKSLDFSKLNGLVADVSDTEDAYLRNILIDTKKKLKIDAIFFLKPTGVGPSIPIIYFKLMDGPNPREIFELHKLSWNIGRAPLLFIVLPDRVLVYNNLVPPKTGDDEAGLIEDLRLLTDVEGQIRRLKQYERAELETGNYWRRKINTFKTNNSIFKKLLESLDDMRQTLRNDGLSSNIVHSILIRSIFIKYLEDRQDGQGHKVFPEGFFNQFRSGSNCFTDLLVDKKATYNFFRYLINKFNGDIFVIEEDEELIVERRHLNLLQGMLRGEKGRQTVLWPLYSFDVIPIELISKIYEQFLALKDDKQEILPKGIHYTPYHLVAYLMDEALPLTDTNINLKVIDPACGSGIFLVEAYRRLIARWMKSNPNENPSASELIRILRNSIFGVDIDENAVRITALSLYLTVCDYLEPKNIWEEIKFEKLMNTNLFHADFFDDAQKFASQKFDLIIANPPWKSELSKFAERYIRLHRKHIGDKQICQAFLWKAADLCESDGRVCMIVSSKALLFNRSSRNSRFRRDFFSSYDIKAILNFSALRHVLFSHAVGPGAAITFSPERPPEGKSIAYCSPKPSFTLEDELSFIIEPQDRAYIPLHEALESEVIWKVSMWGLPRDYELIKKLSMHPSLKNISKMRGWVHAEGYIVGKGGHFTRELVGKPELSVKDLTRYVVRTKYLKKCNTDHFYRWANTQKQIYKGPHLLIRQSPKAGTGFISAVMLDEAVFKQSIVGIHADEKDLSRLIASCLVINSDIPLYYAILTSGRWLIERDELTKTEIMNIPIPNSILNANLNMDFLERMVKDEKFRQAENDKLMLQYGLDESEKTLVEDTIRFTLDRFRHKGRSIAINPADETEVKEYLKTLCITINHAFSSPYRSFRGTVYPTEGPLRMVSLQLEPKNRELVKVERNTNEVETILKRLDEEVLTEEKAGGVNVRRHLIRYSENTIHIIKLNQRRYWSKSSAISDADKIYADIMMEWKAIVDDIRPLSTEL